MARTAIATLQPAWDCRWSRPGHRLSGVSNLMQPESLWVCVREGTRRNLALEECQTCPHWELNDGQAALATGGASIAAPARQEPIDLLAVSVQALLALIAVALFAIGASILTSLLAIPVTVTLWMGAAAFAALAVWWRLPEH